MEVRNASPSIKSSQPQPCMTTLMLTCLFVRFMHPNRASEVRSAEKPSRNTFVNGIATRLAMLQVMLLALVPAASSASQEATLSRRGMLAVVREERAEVDAMRDIAVGFILIGIALVIALAFWPIITSSVAVAKADTNTSTTQGTLLGLIPTVLVVVLLVGAIGFLLKGINHLRSK